MSKARLLRPGLRYIYTSGACATLAAALTRLPACLDAPVIIIVDAEDRDHIVVRAADGRLIDAEGIRTREQIVESFGLKAPLNEVAIDVANISGAHLDALVGLLGNLSWDAGPPEHDPVDDIAHKFEAAKADFDAIGGWNGDPAAMIAAERRRIAMRLKKARDGHQAISA